VTALPITRAATKVASRLRLGSMLMAVAGLAFVGYAVLFFVRNFTGAFLELGIGPQQVDVGRGGDPGAAGGTPPRRRVALT
jgi:hypothetical protein